MGQHSNSYLLLFSFPFLVESLLRDFVPGDWVHNLDFATLEKVSGSYATDDLRSRHDDLVWRVHGRGDDERWIYIYLILEFQLESRFGPLDSAVRRRVQAADAERLLEWGERILSAERLEDVFDD